MNEEVPDRDERVHEREDDTHSMNVIPMASPLPLEHHVLDNVP